MEIDTRAAAAQLGLSQRQVQRLAEGGRVAGRRIAGRTVVSTRSLIALSRSTARGRRWNAATVSAACELLERGTTTHILGSQRSRLRARLAAIPISDLAYQVLADRVTLWRRAQRGAGSAQDSREGLSSSGARLEVIVTPDANAVARKERLLDDADGDTLIVQFDTASPSVIEDIALFAYGDERTSSAARQRIEVRRTALS